MYRLREFHRMGFSGFEGRHYSLFPSLRHDLPHAVQLQQLLTCLAFKYMLTGKYGHEHIPDTSFVESERRQIFFGTAAGIPTFFVRKDTPNLLLKDILAETHDVRISRRYAGYLRIHNYEYRLGLIRVLRRDAIDLIEMLGLQDTLDDLETRLQPAAGAAAVDRLTAGILRYAGLKSPFGRNAMYLNHAAEAYYRTTLRNEHLGEALDFLRDDLERMQTSRSIEDNSMREAMQFAFGSRRVTQWLRAITNRVLQEALTLDEVRSMIYLLLISEHFDAEQEAAFG
jgi:hypothetical protein